METGHQPATPERKPFRAQPGKRKHLVSFVLSVVLTVLAFVAVAVEKAAFVVPYILFLAIVQAVFQLFYWMHLSERGHRFPIIGIAAGAFVALTAVVTAIYWLWW